MERCDFGSIITTVRKYIGDDRGMNQIDLLYELFEGFLEEESSQDFDFDNGLVCRCFKRNAATKKLLAAGTLSPVISDFVYNGDVPKACAHFCGNGIWHSTLWSILL